MNHTSKKNSTKILSKTQTLDSENVECSGNKTVLFIIKVIKIVLDFSKRTVTVL